MKRFYLENLGCSKNVCDGEVVMSSLVERGYQQNNNPQNAEIIILNTCGFIEAAVEESLDRILDLADYKTNGAAKTLVMMGCLSQRYQKDLEKELPEVDIFVGTGYLNEMADVLESGEKFFFDRRDTLILSGKRDPFHLPVAYLKISEGCNNRCTYCLIPSLRGPMRSRYIQEVVEEAKQVLKQGAKELILIAQDVSRFGIDNGESIEELLIQLNALPGTFWIRLQYVYSDLLTRKFFETMSSLDKVVPYLDMPIQHVSDRVLRKMNRHTNKSDILKVIKWAREIVPSIALRTTVMVGFPGESEDDFNELLDFLEENRFERLGAFMYSDEEGAPSQKLDDKVSQKIKQDRLDKLMQLQTDRAEELSSSLIGTVQEVLVEEKGANGVYARTKWDAPEVDCVVYIQGIDCEPGTFLSALITSSDGLDLIGVVNESSK